MSDTTERAVDRFLAHPRMTLAHTVKLKQQLNARAPGFNVPDEEQHPAPAWWPGTRSEFAAYRWESDMLYRSYRAAQNEAADASAQWKREAFYREDGSLRHLPTSPATRQRLVDAERAIDAARRSIEELNERYGLAGVRA